MRTKISFRCTLYHKCVTLVSISTSVSFRHLFLEHYVTHSANISIAAEIGRLGKRLGVRQQAMATAQVYIRRFYSKVEIRRTNPYLVIATAVYLACKMEECPHHIRLVVSEGRALWPGNTPPSLTDDNADSAICPDFFSSDTSKLGECEFFLISEMSSQMIVHQPYRTLSTLQVTLSLTQEETALAWSIINDHYMTDLPLLFAPHTIAIMAILLALVLRPTATGIQSASGSASTIASAAQGALSAASQLKAGGAENKGRGERSEVQRLSNWLSESNVDIEAIVDCTQEIISFYEFQEQYNEKLTREQINRFVKARGLDK
jgi:cyclin C